MRPGGCCAGADTRADGRHVLTLPAASHFHARLGFVHQRAPREPPGSQQAAAESGEPYHGQRGARAALGGGGNNTGVFR
eukprot:4191400-Pyramimonas_sp.AAC.1